MAEAGTERILQGDLSDPQAQDEAWARLVAQVFGGADVPFEEQWALWRRVFARRRPEAGPPIAWRPSEEVVDRSNIMAFASARGVASYDTLWEWSVSDRGGFWAAAVERLGVPFAQRATQVLDASGGLAESKWFPGSRLNCVDACFRAAPERVAIRFGREGEDAVSEWTYRELEALANRVANGLREKGFGAGDALALYMPMTPECVACYLGIVRAGCVVISIADSFAPPEVATRLRLGGAKGIVTVEAFERGGRAIDLYGKVRKALDSLGADGKAIRTVVIPAGAGRAPALEEGDLLWEDLLSDTAAFTSVHSPPETVTNILFSSGTTGDPKAIPWTHLTPVKSAVDGHFHQDIHPEDVVAWPTNIGWMMGPWLIYASLVNGATMALYEGLPTSEGFCRFVERAGVTVLGVVPALVLKWRETTATKGIDWSGIRLFSSTGEASNAHDYLWLMSTTGYRAPVIEYCGGTEIGGGHITGTIVQPASPATFTTPALGIDFVVLNETGKPVEPGGVGELFLIPPSVGLSQRLLNRDHHAVYYEDCPPGPKGETLRRHGDEIAVLHKGFWQAQGRSDDTMNLGGIKVASLELERVMKLHPQVSETAAIAVQPEAGGADQLVVYAVAEKGENPEMDTLKRELQARIKEHLNPLFRIADLVLVESLPRTASNKVMRRELRKAYVGRRKAA